MQFDDYARTFNARGEIFRIAAINLNRLEYPISLERVASGRDYTACSKKFLIKIRHTIPEVFAIRVVCRFIYFAFRYTLPSVVQISEMKDVQS